MYRVSQGIMYKKTCKKHAKTCKNVQKRASQVHIHQKRASQVLIYQKNVQKRAKTCKNVHLKYSFYQKRASQVLIYQKTCKNVYLKRKISKNELLKYFWTQFKIVHCQGPCSLRPCISRPYCNFFILSNLLNFLWQTV